MGENRMEINGFLTGQKSRLVPLNSQLITGAKRNDPTHHPWFSLRFLFGVMLGLDGIMGISPIRYGRDAIGLVMATEGHGARMLL